MLKHIILLLAIFIIKCGFSQTTTTVNSFTFTFSGITTPTAMPQAAIRAGERWSNCLNITVPIKVNINVINNSLAPFTGITFANARQNFTNAPHSNYLYPTALANQIAGTELNVGETDMDIYINLSTPMYYGTGKPPLNQEDFMTLLMHEIGHGLGFTSAGNVNSTNMGSFGNIPSTTFAPFGTSFTWQGDMGVPSVYDKFITKQSTNYLVGLAPNNSTALGDSIRLKFNYFNGTSFANQSNGGNRIKLSGGTGTFKLGVDLLHLHSSVCNAIMSYCWGLGDTVRKPANLELGILKEIGWNILVPIVNVAELKNTNDFSYFPNPSLHTITISAKICK